MFPFFPLKCPDVVNTETHFLVGAEMRLLVQLRLASLVLCSCSAAAFGLLTQHKDA